LLRAADQAPRMLQQHLALFGRRQLLAPAIDQLAADAVFSSAWMLRLNADCDRFTACAPRRNCVVRRGR
jgi:hypothetical protein